MPHDIGSLFEDVKAWGRWGVDDERGALNLLTPQKVIEARNLVQDGTIVSCGRDLGTVPAIDDPTPVQHMMLMAGDAPEASGVPGFEQSTDFLGIACHGMGVSHIDALCHIFVDGHMYNGFAAGDVKSVGALRNSIAGAAQGIVTRGVLIDIPRLRGVSWLDPTDVITADELEAASRAQNSQVRRGDAVVIVTGRDARRVEIGAWSPFDPGLPGLDGSCVRWFADRDIAVLGSDVISDPLPPPVGEPWPFPIHQCCIAGMGVHLIDNLNLADLSEACSKLERWEFLLAVQPLRALRATGCPVNPIAVL